ncbi:MAG: tRNA (guanine(37)-N(1))-methyltransferase [Thiobacillaceae bacterium]|nr:tRNA (guanine(37)-N(1))-methyltransferase [Thiobacillaceae bacterium]
MAPGYHVVTLFPEMFAALTGFGVSGRAVDRRLCSVRFWDPRDFTQDNYRTVDDRPFGGGPGMVMLAEPLDLALIAAKAALRRAGVAKPRLIHLSPQGRRLDQALVEELAAVLSGGELPAMVLLDAVIRQLPGALGHADSAREDSFADGLLDCPHYTRPENWLGLPVPEVLRGGNHAQVARWRLRQALARTRARRPELLAGRALSPLEQELLAELDAESGRR